METIVPILSMIMMIVLFYFFIFIPENKRKKKYNAMLGSLKVNDKVLTRGGIIGTIIKIEDDYIIVQSGPDKARFKLIKSGIASVLNKETSEIKEEKNDSKEKEKKEYKEVKEPEEK